MKTKIAFLIFAVMLTLACQSLAEDGYYDEETESALPAESNADDGGEQSPPAQGKTSAAVTDARVDGIIAESNIGDDAPGGAVLVIDRGRIVHQKGYGLANLDAGQAIAPDTALHLGSVGKQFTALGVMILYEQDELDYDDPIGEYIPELEWTGDEVTIRRLLHHTSGIIDYDESDDLYDSLFEISATPNNEDLLQALSRQDELLYDPGGEFLYSNTGYDILGALIERVSGQSYADFMDGYVFSPLGMTRSFALPSPRRNESYAALSYSGEGGEPEYVEPDPMDNLNGSGSIYSTAGDFYLYDQALYTDKIVKQSTLAEAFEEGELNNGKGTGYGFGWDIGTKFGEDYAGHSGAWLGFTSYYLRFPERQFSVVILLNMDYADPDEETLAFRIAELYLK